MTSGASGNLPSNLGITEPIEPVTQSLKREIEETEGRLAGRRVVPRNDENQVANVAFREVGARALSRQIRAKQEESEGEQLRSELVSLAKSIEDENLILATTLIGIARNMKARVAVVELMKLSMQNELPRVVHDIIEFLMIVPAVQRVRAFLQISPKFRDIFDITLRRDILRALNLFPHEKTLDMLPKIVIQFQEILDPDEREYILEALPLVPEHERTDSFMDTVTLFKNSGNFDGKMLLHFLRERPQDKIAAVIQGAPLCTNKFPIHERCARLMQVGDIPADHRADVIKHVALHCQDFSTDSIIGTVVRIRPDQRGDVLRHSRAFCTDITDDDELYAIIQTVDSILPEERADVCEHAKLACKDITNGHARATALNALSLFPSDEREEARTRILPILKGVSDEGSRSVFISLLKDMQPDQRLDILRTAMPFMANAGDVSMPFGVIILAVHTIFREQPESVMADCMRWFEMLSNPVGLLPLILLSGQVTGFQREEAFQSLQIANLQIATEVRNLLGLEDADYEESSYRIELAREELRKTPLAILNSISAKFHENSARRLYVVFTGEKGSDYGGLGRQFVSELTTGVVDAMQFQKAESGLYRPKLPLKNNQFEPLNDEKKTALKQLGELMMFCLNATRSYPIGMIFDHGVFSALLKFKNEDLESSFEAIVSNSARFNDLFEIYETTSHANEKDIQMIRAMKNALPAMSAEEKSDFVNTTMRAALSPLFEIAKGMKQASFATDPSWTAVQKMSPQLLSEKLQGIVSKEKILQSLQFHANVPERKRQWVREWITACDVAKLQEFLFALSGAYALAKKAKIQIGQVASDKVAFHTCFNILDLPMGIEDKNLLFLGLDFAMKEKGFTTI